MQADRRSRRVDALHLPHVNEHSRTSINRGKGASTCERRRRSPDIAEHRHMSAYVNQRRHRCVYRGSEHSEYYEATYLCLDVGVNGAHLIPLLFLEHIRVSLNIELISHLLARDSPGLRCGGDWDDAVDIELTSDFNAGIGIFFHLLAFAFASAPSWKIQD